MSAMDEELKFRFEDLCNLSEDQLDNISDDEYEKMELDFYHRNGGMNFEADFRRLYYSRSHQGHK